MRNVGKYLAVAALMTACGELENEKPSLSASPSRSNDPCLVGLPQLASVPVFPSASDGNYPCSDPSMRWHYQGTIGYGLCSDEEGNVSSRIETTPGHAAQCFSGAKPGPDAVILINPKTGAVALSQSLQRNGRYATSIAFSLLDVPRTDEIRSELLCAAGILKQARGVANKNGDAIPGLHALQTYVQCRIGDPIRGQLHLVPAR